MEILAKKEVWGKRFYRIKEDDQIYIAECIFVSKKPHSQVMVNVIKEIEKRLEITTGLIKHPLYLDYEGIKQVNEEYCLIRKGEDSLKPLFVYLKDQSPSLEEIVDWVITISEIAQEAEENNINWPQFNFESLWVDERGKIRLIDPVLSELLGKYREGIVDLPSKEVYQAPELYQQHKFDEKTCLYSLGVIFYYLLTGRMPFAAREKADLIDAIIHTKSIEPCFINYQVSSALSNLVMKLLVKDRTKRLQSWEELLKGLRLLKEKRQIKASQVEEESHRSKGDKVVKINKQKEGLRFFWRKRWKTIAISSAIIILLLIITLTGGNPPIVTEDTTPLQVVKYFYQAIDQKDILMLDDTTVLDLKNLERMVSETYVMEKMQSAYSVNETDSNKSLFGIKGLKITLITQEPQPVFRANYLFYINHPELSDESEMVDLIKLGNVEGRWQIVELDGDVNGLISGEMGELQEREPHIN